VQSYAWNFLEPLIAVFKSLGIAVATQLFVLKSIWIFAQPILHIATSFFNENSIVLWWAGPANKI